MCIAYLAVNSHPQWPLFIAANRDELHQRPAQTAKFWEHSPQVLAGVDEQGGGTWVGITRTGRFALITNYRDPSSLISNAPSRGDLTRHFLEGTVPAGNYAAHVAQQGHRYNGFNLILGQFTALNTQTVSLHAFYIGNRSPTPDAITLPAGRHVLSNHLLNTPWPKAQRLRAALDTLELEQLPERVPEIFTILRDDTPAQDHTLPNTGLSLERERLLSSPFIVSPNYGTRCSSIIAVHCTGNAFFSELTYNAQGAALERNDWPFQLSGFPDAFCNDANASSQLRRGTQVVKRTIAC